MTQGAKVRHPSLGEGTVVESSPRRGVKVDFGYAWTWVSEEEIEIVDGVLRMPPNTTRDQSVPGWQIPEPSAGEPESTESRIPELPTGVVDAKRAILALKLGQILEENVRDLSVGVHSIRTDLEKHVAATARRTPRTILVEGAWGTGKTHLLTLLTALAAKEGLATASVILDGEGVGLSEPMGLMDGLLGSLRYPGETAPRGIGRRLIALRHHVNHSRAERHLGSRLAKAIFEVPPRTLDDSEAVEVLEEYFIMKLSASQAMTKLRQLGWRIRLPSLRAQRIVDRANRLYELLRGWAEFCALTGAKGLVVVFDELDVEYAMTKWRSSLRVLRGTLLAKLSSLQDDNCPLLLAFGSAPTSDDVGDENDAVRDVMKHVPWTTHIIAPRPSLEQTLELGRRLQTLYTGAFPDRMADVDGLKVQQLISAFADQHLNGLDPTPRDFVRGTIERLDLAPSLEGYTKST